jgi:hypothetical protein
MIEHKQRPQFSKEEAKDKPRMLAQALSANKVAEAVVAGNGKTVLHTPRGDVVTDSETVKAMKGGTSRIYEDLRAINPVRAEKIVNKYTQKTVYQK